MRIIKLQENNLKEVAQLAAKHLKEGQVIVYPTDTLYGLGCDWENKQAIDLIEKIKKRPEGKPFSVIMRDITMIRAYAKVTERDEKVIRLNLPGKYTFVLKAKRNLYSKENWCSETIGIRIPDNLFTRELSKIFPNPYISTSMNITGAEPLNDSQIIIKKFNKRFPQPDFLIDGGKISEERGIPLGSTVIDLTCQKIKFLRMGNLKPRELKKLLKSFSFDY